MRHYERVPVYRCAVPVYLYTCIFNTRTYVLVDLLFGTVCRDAEVLL